MSLNLTQAVILCGGLGTRLLPLTKDLPKPMVSVNGVPFLEHLITQLRSQGITKCLLLTGYLHEKIEKHFGDGHQWDMQITYSHGEVEWETGRRIFRAQHLLEKHFFLLYGDNFYNYDLSKLKSFYEAHSYPLTLIVTSKTNGNIRLSPDGKIEAYDATRKGEGFSFVELGFMVVDKSVVDLIDDSMNPSFSKTIELLAQSGKIGGFWGRDIYHSISDPKRLNLLEQFLKRKKIILIDRDGTINEKAPRGRYITKPEDLKIIPESLTGLKKLAQAGFSFIIITNQAGLATRDLLPDSLEAIHSKMLKELSENGVHVEKIYVSDAHWQDHSNWFRKPNPGLFFEISRDYQLYLKNTYYIGDDSRDMVAALNANTNGIYFGIFDHQKFDNNQIISYSSASMMEIADYILREFNQ